MNKKASIYAYLKEKRVHPSNNFPAASYAGKALDELHLNGIELKSQKDCDELIEFLQVHQQCFQK